MSTHGSRGKTVIAYLLGGLTLAGCAAPLPSALPRESLIAQSVADREAASREVPAITAPLTLEDAMARALKYNLDRRARLLEEAIALGTLDVAQLDMLPKLMANADRTSRDNDRISQSRDSSNGALSPSRFISSDRNHTERSLGLSWNMLDLGVGYYGAQQQADRVLIAAERRRRATHALLADVRTAYWRAASAQRLKQDIEKTRQAAQEALAESRKSENERLRNPLDALRYQRQLLENLRLLESVNQELARAQIELAALINAPRGVPFTLAQTELSADPSLGTLPIERLEDHALEHNPDLREAHYQSRIARLETRRTLSRLFPGLNFSFEAKYDTDSYLVNNRWNEAGVSLSFNLMNLFTGPMQMSLAEAGVELADQRRVAMQMAVLTQVHLARLQLAQSEQQLARADEIWQVEHRISQHTANRETATSATKLERIGADTAAILSQLRRYQAMAEWQAAAGRLAATLGLEPMVSAPDSRTLAELTEDMRQAGGGWGALTTPSGSATK